MTFPAWARAVNQAVDVSAPYVLLGWAWVRWKRDPFRASFARWRDHASLLTLMLATTGAVMYALYASGQVHVRTFEGYFDPWPPTFVSSLLYILAAGLLLSLLARGLLRFLVCASCLWLAALCLMDCCMPERWLDWLDTL